MVISSARAFVVCGLLTWVLFACAYGLVSESHWEFPFEVNAEKCVEATIIYIALLFISPKRMARPSDFLVVVILFCYLLPLLIFYALANQERQHLYIVLVGFFIIERCRRGRLFRVPLVRNGREIAVLSLVVIAALVSGWFLVSGGTLWFNLDFAKVYELRREVGAVVDVGVMAYVNQWAFKVAGPALLVIALLKKNYMAAAGVVALHVVWFGVSSHKAVLFFPILVLCIWGWNTRTREFWILPLAMAMLAVGTSLLLLGADEGFAISLLVRRAFFVLSRNTFDYYTFFGETGFVYWSNGPVGLLPIDYPDGEAPADVIGAWRGTDSHVNTTFLATGYMHAGIVGVFMYCVAVGMLFKLIDSLAKDCIPVWVALSVPVAPVSMLLFAADLPTALVTHGLGLGLLVLALLRERVSAEESSAKVAAELVGSRAEIALEGRCTGSVATSGGAGRNVNSA